MKPGLFILGILFIVGGVLMCIFKSFLFGGLIIAIGYFLAHKGDKKENDIPSERDIVQSG